MRPIIITAFLFVAVCVNAQLPYLDKTFGNSGVVFNENINVFNSINFDNNRNIICETAKYTPNGSLDLSFWKNGIFPPSPEPPILGYNTAVTAVFPDGKTLIGGMLDSGNLFFAKFNPDGTFDNSFGEAGIHDVGLADKSAYFRKIIPLEYDDFLVVTWAWIAKFNADGSFDDTFGSEGRVVFADYLKFKYTQIWTATVLSDNSIVCGGTAHFKEELISEEGVMASLIIKMDANGNLVSSFGSNGILLIDLYKKAEGALSTLVDYCPQICKLNDGRLIIACNIDQRKMVLVKLHENGSFDKSFGDNGMVTSGLFYANFDVHKANDNIFLTNMGSENFLTILNSSGKVIFDGGKYPSLTPPALRNLSSKNVKIQPDGKVLLCGSSDNKAILVRLTFDDIISIDDTESNAGFSIYPNPTSEAITISAEEQIKEVLVFNAAGQLLFSQSGNSNTLQINLSYPSGIYNITAITTDGKRYTRKIVKE